MTTTIRNMFQRMSMDARQKTLLHILEVSIKAVMNALRERGVSEDSLLQLEVHSDHQRYKDALDLGMEYLTNVFEDDEELVQLMVCAWHALCSYRYRIWRKVFREWELRFENPRPKKNLRKQLNDVQAQLHSCEVMLIKTQKIQKRLELYKAWEKRQEEERQQQQLDEIESDERDTTVEQNGRNTEEEECDGHEYDDNVELEETEKT